jgi:hypothetical protein
LTWPPTRLAALSRPLALAAAVALVVLVAWSLPSGAAARRMFAAAPSGGGDLVLYARVAARVHAGESYYAAAAEELVRGGYPTRELSPWRLPLLSWLIGTLPDPRLAQALLLALIALASALAWSRVRAELGAVPAVLQLLLYVGIFAVAVGELFYASELWAGALIALSLECYARGWRKRACAAGAAALAVRELALLYALVCLGLALVERRRREVAAWLGVLALFGAYYYAHALAVAAHRLPGGLSAGSWLQLGGLAFVLVTCQVNAWLLGLPSVASALFFTLGVVGLVGWPGQFGRRAALTVAAYAGCFLFVGKNFNFYWGFLYQPILTQGVVRAPAALRDLITACRAAGSSTTAA